MRPVSLGPVHLLAVVILWTSISFLSTSRVSRAGSTNQEPSKETSSAVMLGVNPGRTRAYDTRAVIHPNSVQWKTSKLFVVDRSYPLTLTFEGIPGMSSQTVWMPSGHGFTDPVMIDGSIYFSLYINDGYVFAQQSATGGDKWRFKLPHVRFSPIAVAGNVVVAAASNGTLLALNAATGQMLWTKEQKGHEFYNAAPLVAKAVVYFSSSEYSTLQNVRPNGRIIALELGDGNELWVYKTKATLGAAAYADKTIFVGDSDGYLHALDAPTGHERWKFKGSRGGVPQPAIKNGVVYFSSGDGSLYAVDAQTGQELWKNTKGAKVATLLALDDSNIYFGGENLSLYAVDMANGQVKWRYETQQQCHSPVLAGGIVSFTSGDVMMALDTTTGAENWRVTGLNKVVSSPILGSGAVYFLDGEGHLYALK